MEMLVSCGQWRFWSLVVNGDAGLMWSMEILVPRGTLDMLVAMNQRRCWSLGVNGDIGFYGLMEMLDQRAGDAGPLWSLVTCPYESMDMLVSRG